MTRQALEELLTFDSGAEVIQRIVNPHQRMINELRSVYIYGTGVEARSAAQGLATLGVKVLGFISDFGESSPIEGIPVLRLKETPNPGTPVVVAALGSAAEMKRNLDQRGFQYRLEYGVLHRFNRELFPLPTHHRFYDSALQIETVANKHRFAQAYELFHDDLSRAVFDAVIRYRLTLDPSMIASVAHAPQLQYFDPLLEFSDDEVMVDGGAWVGDTTLEFCQHVSSYRHIYLFEPDPDVIVRARSRLSHLDRISFIEAALYSSQGTQHFNATSMSDGSIDPAGSITVQTVTLDETIKEAPTFIKMDIEGAELDALVGGRKSIVESRPKLAICVYHHANHLWQIPDWIANLSLDYRLYLRNYGPAHEEIVLYCV